jgi:hypothetical protein
MGVLTHSINKNKASIEGVLTAQVDLLAG